MDGFRSFDIEPLTMQYKRPESVLVVVYTTEKYVLLLHRVNPPHFWQSVAGSLAWSERKEEAAQRELFEETGLTGKSIIACEGINRFLIYPMWRNRYAPHVIENTEYVFRVELESTCAIQLDAKEHSEFLWLPAKEAALAVSSHTNRIAIQQWVK